MVTASRSQPLTRKLTRLLTRVVGDEDVEVAECVAGCDDDPAGDRGSNSDPSASTGHQHDATMQRRDRCWARGLPVFCVNLLAGFLAHYA